jgi:hypothetical protein
MGNAPKETREVGIGDLSPGFAAALEQSKISPWPRLITLIDQRRLP